MSNKIYLIYLLRSSRQEVFFRKGVLEAVAQRCPVKKVFLDSQNSQEYTCVRVSFLIKLQAWDLQLY